MSDRSAPDIRLDGIEQRSVLDGLDHFSGIAVLLLIAMVGFDLYFWLALHKPPHMSIVWFPGVAANILRRVTSDEGLRPWPVSWSRTLAVYSVIVLAVVLIKRPATWEDWTLAVFAAGFAGMWLWKATRR